MSIGLLPAPNEDAYGRNPVFKEKGTLSLITAGVF